MNYRQGEVLIFGLKPSKKKPTELGFTLKEDGVIAEGEISGHLHAVTNGKLYEQGDKMILEAEKGCILTHPEHKSVPIPEGKYEIQIQVEFNEEKHTKVKD